MKNIKSYTQHELDELFTSFSQPRFRTKQLVKWLYQAGVSSFDEMTNFPKELRKKLQQETKLTRPALIEKRISKDGTRKYLWEFDDGCGAETVAIPSRSTKEGEPQRLTICFSTQVGCSLACQFCATGREGFTRNLLVGEIVDQVLLAGRDMDMRVSNVVAMGQGEPFLNYDNLIEALRILNSPDGLGIGARHITLSTSGILSGIRKLSEEPEQFTLAVSLHSAIQDSRDTLMPRMQLAPLSELKKALLSYVEKTNRRVSLEYLLLRDVNDNKDHLDALISFSRDLLCHINILPCNPIEGTPFKPSSVETRARWLEYLEKAGIEATVRDSRGSDIEGACGQLKHALQPKK